MKKSNFLFLALIIIAIAIGAYVIVKEKSCELRGGKKFMGAGVEVCSIPTKDSGKVCTDGGQCESSYCIAENEGETAGTCWGSNVFTGCHYLLDNGLSKGALCD